MTPHPDAIADCVLATFDQLPDKRKPRPRTDGVREWVPLAGIVLADKDGKLSCVSLGTGMKCLPSTKLPLAKGNVLHDWHAEILAIRAFNRFLLDELLLMLTPPYPKSMVLRARPADERTPAEPHPFALKDDVEIHMYCSEAPCGDASMELTMAQQEDATPWTTPLPTVSSPSPSPSLTPHPDHANENPAPTALRGRSHFSHLGHLRLKPSRPDAPPTLSKSCTDKLALAQCTSLLSALPSTLISPSRAYIATLVLPDSQHIPSATARAFSAAEGGRMSAVRGRKWEGGYAFRGFEVRGTTREFRWSRRAIPPSCAPQPSNLSAMWTPAWQETLIGGVLQGRKQFDPRGASRICRKSLWVVALKIAVLAGLPGVAEALGRGVYADVKGDAVLAARRGVKRDVRVGALRGWVGNAGDDGFVLEA